MKKRPAPAETNPRAKTAAISTMAVFAAVSLFVTVVQFIRGDAMLASRGLLFPLFLLIPLLFRAIGLRHSWRLYCLLYAFFLFAYCYGSVWGAFRSDYQMHLDPALFPAWLRPALEGNFVMDKVSHFLSGFIFTILGFCLYFWQAGDVPGGPRSAGPLCVGYALFFSAFVSVMWEVFEFFDFALTGNDSQNHLTTGVMDTMGDIMAHMAASFISVLCFVLWRKTKVKLLTAAVVEEFYLKNAEGRPSMAQRRAEKRAAKGR